MTPMTAEKRLTRIILPACLLCLIATSSAMALGEQLTVMFSTTTANGHYTPNNIHVAWVEDSTGAFVQTIGLWANRRAHSFQEWDTVTTSYESDIDARTGATQTGYHQYIITWDCETHDGALIPDGTYTVELELTEEDDGSPRHRATFTWVKGPSHVWTPANQGGYTNVRIEYQAGGLGAINTGASNVTTSSATLNGEVSGSGSENPQVLLYWGDNDGGTSPSMWDNAVSLGTKPAGPVSADISGLTYGGTYYYRYFVQDSTKTAWAPSTESFDAVITSTVFEEFSVWHYFKGLTFPTGWNARDYTEGHDWLSGPAGIGYSDGDDNTVLTDMQNNYLTVYMRYKFNVEYPPDVRSMQFTAVYDDGFVAFINGVEVARYGVAEGQTNTTAATSHEFDASIASKDITSFKSALVPGENVFAIEVHNTSLGSSDLSMMPTLVIRGGFKQAQGEIAVNPSELVFSQQPTGGSQTLALNVLNTGDAEVNVSGLNINGIDADSFSLVGASVPFTLAPETGSQPLTVRFSPAQPKSALHADLAITSDDPTNRVLLVPLTGQSSARPQVLLAPKSSLGGPCGAVKYYPQSRLLAGFGSKLCVLDVADEASPTPLGSVALNGRIIDLAVFGSTAYAALGSDGVAAVSLGNPANPTVLFTIDTPGYAHQVAANTGVLMVADGPAGMLVYDISTNFRPTLRTTYQTSGSAVALVGAIQSIRIPSNLTARVLDDQTGLLVLDVTKTPPTPRQILDQFPASAAMASYGTTVYLADRLGGAFDVDLSPYPAAPLITPFTAQAPPVAMAADTTGLFAVCGNAGLEVFTTTGPAPESVAAINLSGDCVDVAASAAIAYVANADRGLQIVDATDIAAVRVAATFNPTSAPTSLAAAQSTVLAADSAAGLQSIDPDAPAVINATDTADQPRDIAVSGNFACLANGASGLQIVDVTDPTSPILRGSYPTAGFAGHVAVSDNIAAVSDGLSVYVLSVSNPDAPALTGVWKSDGWASGLAIDGSTLYVANGGRGLQMLNLPDASPIASLQTPAVACDIAISNGLALIAAGRAGLLVYQQHSPTNFTPLSTFDTPGIATGVNLIDSRVCVADTSGISVVDIANPSEPTLYTSSPVPVTAWASIVSGSRILVADDRGGLLVLGVDAIPHEIPADINNDGLVNLLDVASIASGWLDNEKSLVPMPSDLDGSDVIDFGDLAIILQHWLQ